MPVTKTHLWKTWQSMKKRCLCKTNGPYKNYGGRGIKVCDTWLTFYGFHKWATANGYKVGLSLDRINVGGNYCPENCRWIEPKLQLRNSRHNRKITAFGETKILVEWVEDKRCSITYNALLHRLNRGWNPEQAISTAAVTKGK